jgi:hypothetical protein
MYIVHVAIRTVRVWRHYARRTVEGCAVNATPARGTTGEATDEAGAEEPASTEKLAPASLAAPLSGLLAVTSSLLLSVLRVAPLGDASPGKMSR